LTNICSFSPSNRKASPPDAATHVTPKEDKAIDASIAGCRGAIEVSQLLVPVLRLDSAETTRCSLLINPESNQAWTSSIERDTFKALSSSPDISDEVTRITPAGLPSEVKPLGKPRQKRTGRTYSNKFPSFID
jgi:hypothetical protein